MISSRSVHLQHLVVRSNDRTYLVGRSIQRSSDDDVSPLTKSKSKINRRHSSMIVGAGLISFHDSEGIFYVHKSPFPYNSIAALVDHIARHLADNGCLLNFVRYVLILSFSSPLFIPWTIFTLRGELQGIFLTRENCETFNNSDL